MTNPSTGARAPRWSPDEKAILLTSDVSQGATTDADGEAHAWLARWLQ